MKPHEVTRQQARWVALNAAQLGGQPIQTEGAEGAARLINNLGYVQIDTINVILRAHHHVLATRLPDYDEGHIDLLQKQRREIFEYWGHALSYLPMKDYRYYLPKMEERKEKRSAWMRRIEGEFGHLVGTVLDRISSDGPIPASAVETNLKALNDGWEFKPAKMALTLLAMRGEVMISHREQFELFYDLPERVVPAGVDTSLPSHRQRAEFIVQRSMKGLGIARLREMRKFLGGADVSEMKSVLKQQCEEGRVSKVTVSGDESKQSWYVDTALLESTQSQGTTESTVHLLSPFDNLVIRRDRLERLFNFTYTLECYLPAAKRTFGYFSLPILWHNRIVGRLDPKADRQNQRFLINVLHLEKEIEDMDRFLPAFASAIRRLADICGCNSCRLEKTQPARYKSTLRQALRQAF